MFLHNYCFKGVDGSREMYFYKQGITKKEAIEYATYLKNNYHLRFVQFFQMGKVVILGSL